MTKSHNEMDLVKDFIEVADRATNDLKHITENEGLYNSVLRVRMHHPAKRLKGHQMHH